jgi:hypothetical protein
MMDTEEHSLFTLDPTLDNMLDAEPDTTHESERVEVIAGVLVRVAPQSGNVARYEETYVEPVRRLRATLSDVLDVDANPDRAPEEALTMLKHAMDTFNEESATWL